MQRIHPTAKKLKVTGKELLTPWKEDSESLLQFEGGSIGSILTCVLAKTSMICNTRKLKQKLQYLKIRWFDEKKSELRSVKSVIKYNIQVREIGVKLFKVYVNDEFVVSSSIGPDWRYDKVEKRMLWTKQFYAEDKDVSNDLLKARLITDISNDLDSDIKITLDCPYL